MSRKRRARVVQKTVEAADGVRADQQQPGEPPADAIQRPAGRTDRSQTEPREIDIRATEPRRQAGIVAEVFRVVYEVQQARSHVEQQQSADPCRAWVRSSAQTAFLASHSPISSSRS